MSALTRRGAPEGPVATMSTTVLLLREDGRGPR